ncbi:MAG: hypothetical protein ACQEQL_01720 [Pseudomonadota bacterium]
MDEDKNKSPLWRKILWPPLLNREDVFENTLFEYMKKSFMWSNIAGLFVWMGILWSADVSLYEGKVSHFIYIVMFYVSFYYVGSMKVYLGLAEKAYHEISLKETLKTILAVCVIFLLIINIGGAATENGIFGLGILLIPITACFVTLFMVLILFTSFRYEVFSHKWGAEGLVAAGILVIGYGFLNA